MHSAACRICAKPLRGRQRLFCGQRCKNQATNSRHQRYVSQQARGASRKAILLAAAGGRCARCGYDGNHAALTFHHRDPASKRFNLDLRSLSNRSWLEVQREAALCELLCANCRAEVDHPVDRVYGQLAAVPSRGDGRPPASGQPQPSRSEAPETLPITHARTLASSQGPS